MPHSFQLNILIKLSNADLSTRLGKSEATRMIPNRHGELYEAFDFDVPLRVVALTGSTPPEWEQDFRDLLRGRGKLQIDKRRQLLEIYEELQDLG